MPKRLIRAMVRDVNNLDNRGVPLTA